MLLEFEGDIFTSKDSLVHCVGQDLIMSKGIAIQFKLKFGGIRLLEQQGKTVGQVAYLKLEDRFIFCLITKQSSRFDRPSIKHLRLCLQELKILCQKFNLNRLAMPKIGSGNDKLDWKEVKLAIEDVFGDSDMVIKIYTMAIWEGNLRSKECRDTMKNRAFEQRRYHSRPQQNGTRRNSVNSFVRSAVSNNTDLTSRDEPNNDIWLAPKFDAQPFESNAKQSPVKPPVISDTRFDEFDDLPLQPKPKHSPIRFPSPINLMPAEKINLPVEEEAQRGNQSLSKNNKLFAMALSDTFSQDVKKPTVAKTGGGSFVRKTFTAPTEQSQALRYRR